LSRLVFFLSFVLSCSSCFFCSYFFYFILWHVDPLLDNGREISSYKTSVIK
jgi:hypothetical protein